MVDLLLGAGAAFAFSGAAFLAVVFFAVVLGFAAAFGLLALRTGFAFSGVSEEGLSMVAALSTDGIFLSSDTAISWSLLSPGPSGLRLTVLSYSSILYALARQPMKMR